MQHHRFKHSGLLPYIKDVVISDEVGFVKPQKEIFDLALERLGVRDRSKVLFVGDNPSADIEGANKAGIDSCWVDMPGRVMPETIVPKYSISNICEVVSILERT